MRRSVFPVAALFPHLISSIWFLQVNYLHRRDLLLSVIEWPNDVVMYLRGIKNTIALRHERSFIQNRTIKAHCLTEIAKQFGVTSVEVKEKLGNMRRQFLREHLKVKNY